MAEQPQLSQTVSLFVNRRPKITAPLTLSQTIDVPLEIPIQFSDPDQDTVTLSATGLPEDAVLSPAQFDPETRLFMMSLDWDAPFAGNYTVLLEATDSLSATIQQTIELELKIRWRVTLHPDRPNLLHIPISDARLPTVGRLFDLLHPHIGQIVAYDPPKQTFRTYTNLSAPGGADDLPLHPYTGVIVFLKAGSAIQGVTFEGIPYAEVSVPIVGSESGGEGINLIGLPLNDPGLRTLNDLKTHFPQITEIIGQDGEGRLVSIEPVDLPITGAQAFIVFSKASIQLDLIGEPWMQEE